MKTNLTARLSLLAAPLAFATSAVAQIQLPNDHVDLGIGLHDNELELHWHIEEPAPGVEYAPDAAYVFLPLSSSITRPAGSAWDFTGTVEGTTVHIAPEVEPLEGSVIFLGIGSEEIAPGTLVGDSVTFILTGFSGPGAYSLWQNGGFPSFEPSVLLSTTDNLTSFNLITGGHAHHNWGFTAPGIYNLTFTVSGVLNDGFSTPVSDTATFIFAVGTPIPEPSSAAALAGFAMLGAATLRRRRRA